MAYEIELKAVITDKNRVIKELTDRGCIWGGRRCQHDIAFRKLEHSFTGKTTEFLFRIRQEDGINTLTLKQVLNEVEVIELESTIGDPHSTAKMIQAIGFEEYATIHKVRTKGKLNEFTICIDEVEQLGDFIEVEIVAKNDCLRQEVQKAIYDFLFSIGISYEQICKDRYHTMIHNIYRG